MFSLNLIEIVIYLLPGYLISSLGRYQFATKSDEFGAKRAIECIIISVIFYVILQSFSQFDVFFKAINQGYITSAFTIANIALYGAFIVIGIAFYTMFLTFWAWFISKMYGKGKERFVFAAFSKNIKKRKKRLNVYFKLENDNSLYYGTIHQGDLTEGSEIWLKDVHIQKTSIDEDSSYQYFSDNMLINREKVIYLLTKEKGCIFHV